jgi:DNA repair photolyase
VDTKGFIMKSKARKITKGTREWADSNVNCYQGCSNNCRYCYARKMAIRFGRKTEDTWKIMVPNMKAIKKGYNKRNGRIMFPSSHDITAESLENCLVVLAKLLDAGNEVLVTTKPRFNCVKKVCETFSDKKDLMQFRFTITSNNDTLLNFWEPGAPSFQERVDSLKYAFNHGFKTSVSIEPYLDEDPFLLVEKIRPFITESIWIGKMNYIRANNLSPFEEKYYNKIREIISKKNLERIVQTSKKYERSFLRIKDSIFNYISKYQNTSV